MLHGYLTFIIIERTYMNHDVYELQKNGVSRTTYEHAQALTNIFQIRRAIRKASIKTKCFEVALSDGLQDVCF